MLPKSNPRRNKGIRLADINTGTTEHGPGDRLGWETTAYARYNGSHHNILVNEHTRIDTIRHGQEEEVRSNRFIKRGFQGRPLSIFFLAPLPR